ncbi:hypothetical protein V5097_09795 [Arenibacter palladensis]|uniref:hypothetical protein n=1 Tax=Arenibacter palladensis TaxID=237373 RepID=UPI002FD6FA39
MEERGGVILFSQLKSNSSISIWFKYFMIYKFRKNAGRSIERRDQTVFIANRVENKSQKLITVKITKGQAIF